MEEIRIGSFNCRGLGNFQKRRDVLNYLKGSGLHILFLQDIHCEANKENRFRNIWGRDILIAGFSNNARGVAILTNSIDISFSETKLDNCVNFIITKAKVNNEMDLILANVYGPNTDNPAFYQEVEDICNTIRGDSEIPIILAGDFNVALDFALDTENYERHNNPRSREKLGSTMGYLSLIDVFRDRNPTARKLHGRSVTRQENRLALTFS